MIDRRVFALMPFGILRTAIIRFRKPIHAIRGIHPGSSFYFKNIDKTKYQARPRRSP